MIKLSPPCELCGCDYRGAKCSEECTAWPYTAQQRAELGVSARASVVPPRGAPAASVESDLPMDDGLCREPLVGLPGWICGREIAPGSDVCAGHSTRLSGPALAAEHPSRLCACGKRARSGGQCSDCRADRLGKGYNARRRKLVNEARNAARAARKEKR